MMLYVFGCTNYKIRKGILASHKTLSQRLKFITTLKSSGEILQKKTEEPYMGSSP